MKEKLKNKKVIIFIVGFILLVLIGIFLFIKFTNDDKSHIAVTYKPNSKIEYNDFSKKFEDKRTITVKNTSKEDVKYDLRWFNVENTLTKQNKFIYSITCKGKKCDELGISQVPVADAPVFTNLTLAPGETHVLSVSIKNIDTDKDVKFTGELKPVEVK